MNKVITINLNGVAYQLEEGGYDALRAYLEHAARRLEGNPDKDEIITDIEQSIADKFRALLGAHKTVVNVKEVEGVIEEMGPVEDASAGGPEIGAASKSAAGQGSASAASSARAEQSAAPAGARRLYRIEEGAMIAGVCNGLAAYVNLDVTIVRLAFTLLTFLWGTGLLVYVIMAVIVPAAKTPTERAAAAGMAATAQEFIKRAREGYYEGMKSFHDKHTRRAWKRRFKHDMRSWKYNFHQQMHTHAQHWQQHGRGPDASHPVPIFGPVFLAPLLSILLLGLVMLMVYAIYMVVTTHAVFGVILPATMPVWAGIVAIVLLYLFVAWPIKAIRYACYFPGHYPHRCGPFGGFFGSLVGMFFLAFGIWTLDRHVPEFHEWLVQLPDLLHRGIDAVQSWFSKTT